jgi:hypothetical protein
MPTSAFNKINSFVVDLGNGVHNFSSHQLRLMLTNTAPVATNTIKANLTDITAQNGYSAGGPNVTTTSWSQTSGLAKLVLADVTITASGGSIGPFRYPVLWNDTPTSPADPLIGWYDYGTNLTLADGESLTVDLDQTNGAISLQ